MSDDLVKRLRYGVMRTRMGTIKIRTEAADEIERLLREHTAQVNLCLSANQRAEAAEALAAEAQEDAAIQLRRAQELTTKVNDAEAEVARLRKAGQFALQVLDASSVTSEPIKEARNKLREALAQQEQDEPCRICGGKGYWENPRTWQRSPCAGCNTPEALAQQEKDNG